MYGWKLTLIKCICSKFFCLERATGEFICVTHWNCSRWTSHCHAGRQLSRVAQTKLNERRHDRLQFWQNSNITLFDAIANCRWLALRSRCPPWPLAGLYDDMRDVDGVTWSTWYSLCHNCGTKIQAHFIDCTWLWRITNICLLAKAFVSRISCRKLRHHNSAQQRQH